MESNKEKVSYCIGLETGKNLRRQFDDIDEKLVLDGLSDGITGVSPKLPQDEVTNLLQMLRQQIEDQQKEFMKRFAEENKHNGEQFLEQNKSKEGVKTLSSGLQYKVLQSGTGPQPTFLDAVSVHYKGTFIDGFEFDSSYKRGESISFPLNGVIPGWTEGMQQVGEGGMIELEIPSKLGYGERGAGSVIPGGATLHFLVELIAVK